MCFFFRGSSGIASSLKKQGRNLHNLCQNDQFFARFGYLAIPEQDLHHNMFLDNPRVKGAFYVMIVVMMVQSHMLLPLNAHFF